MRLSSLIFAGAMMASFALTACSSSDSNKKVKLEGERISVLQLQSVLEPDPGVAGDDFTLPEAWVNGYWPQAGGYPDHAMRHVAINSGELKRAWSSDIGTGSNKQRRLVTQPIVAEDKIFVMDTKGVVTAFNSAEGKRLWRVSVVPKGEELTALTGGLAFGEHMLYVTDGYGYVLALDPNTGEKIWQNRTKIPSRAAPTVLDGRVYVVTLANELIALSARDGSVLWRHNGIQETSGLLGAPSPAASGNTVIVAYSSGEVFALRSDNGQVAWADNLATVRGFGGAGRLADIRGLPVISNDMVFVGSTAGRFVALNTLSGNRVWQREIATTETPWIVGNYAFVTTSQNELVAFTRNTGKIRWVLALPRYENEKRKKDPIVWSRPIMAGGRLILTNSNRKMWEIEPATGDVLRETKLSDSVTIAPIVANETLYILTDNGYLQAYR